MEWISIENPPQISGHYNTFHSSGICAVSEYLVTKNAWVFDMEWYDGCIQPCDGAYIDNVTHWMPLPERPQKEQFKAITIDVHINDKRIDVDDFMDMVAIAMDRAVRRS